MNLEFGVCPRCKLEISQERLQDAPVICNHCGFTDQKSMRNLDDRSYSRFLKYSIGLALIMVLSFIQTVNWDQYAIEIIPLKVKELAGAASSEDLKRIKDICQERKKWDCVESALFSIYEKQPEAELDALADLGKLQYQRNKIPQALVSFEKYFAEGGLSLDASYDYARTLSAAGKVDEASQTFEQVLSAKPDTLQVTVVQNYVRLLMNHNRYAQAKNLIEDIRKQGSTANLFMDKEFQRLQQQGK